MNHTVISLNLKGQTCKQWSDCNNTSPSRLLLDPLAEEGRANLVGPSWNVQVCKCTSFPNIIQRIIKLDRKPQNNEMVTKQSPLKLHLSERNISSFFVWDWYNFKKVQIHPLNVIGTMVLLSAHLNLYK